MTSDVITLPDGRRLRWHEFGDPGGSPVFYTAGTPVSGLGGATYDQAARFAGCSMSPWLAPAPSQVTISRRRRFGGSAATAAAKASR